MHVCMMQVSLTCGFHARDGEFGLSECGMWLVVPIRLCGSGLRRCAAVLRRRRVEYRDVLVRCGAAPGRGGGLSVSRRRGARAFGAAQVSNTREFALIAPGFQSSTRRVAILLPNTESFFSRILRKRQTNFRYWEAFLEVLE